MKRFVLLLLIPLTANAWTRTSDQQIGGRAAQLAPREMVVPKLWLQVKNVDAPLQAKLKDTARTIEGSELRECAP